jgi:hypothetical protein
MDRMTVGAWTVGALAGLAAAVIIRRKNTPGPDPEAKLRELIGPEGMALRERNRAEGDAKWNAELLESVLGSARKLREKGDAAGAEKLEAYAATLRGRKL